MKVYSIKEFRFKNAFLQAISLVSTVQEKVKSSGSSKELFDQNDAGVVPCEL